ncbi:MAG: hypothetical protein DI570_02405 [Phenylobacterium zucineum]|nr:MAG: hypothetical protein DI570_02405 [Phenylobacterium zucineum]
MTPQVRRYLGAGLMAVGALVTALCGGCGALFAGGALIGLASGDDAGLATTILAAAAVLGGLPALAGFLLFTLGRRFRNAP